MVERRRGIIYRLDISAVEFLRPGCLCLFAPVHVQEEDENIGLDPRQLPFGVWVPFVPECLQLGLAGPLGSIGVGGVEHSQFALVYKGKNATYFHCCRVRPVVIILIGEGVEGGGKFVGFGHLGVVLI